MPLVTMVADHVGLWAVGVVIILLQVAAYILGCLLRRWHVARPDEGDTDSYTVSGVLGLLALLLGFTFALAVDRFETRRLLVLDEANAIRATYLRAQTFEEPSRSQLSGLITAYLDNRLALGSASEPEVIAKLSVQTAQLQRAMWQTTRAAVQPVRDDVSASFMDSMSGLIETGAARRAEREAHVPPRIFTILLIYLIASSGVLGYVIGIRRWVTALFLFVLTNMSYLLIVDIDGATTGEVTESQQPMEDLKELFVANGIGPDKSAVP